VPQSTEMTAKTKKEEAILYKCEPVHWVSFPKPLRLVLGWATVLMFGFSFLTVPMCFVFFVPAVWRTAPVAASVALGSVVLSMCLPLKEWYVLNRYACQDLFELGAFTLITYALSTPQAMGAQDRAVVV
jgi:hypothetical protein